LVKERGKLFFEGASAPFTPLMDELYGKRLKRVVECMEGKTIFIEVDDRCQGH